MLLDLSADIPIHSKAVMLLQRVTSFEGIAEADAGILLKKMSLGDRVSLLLNLRKLMKGDNISCTINCPKCGNAMSADISITKLLETTSAKLENDYCELTDDHDGGLSFHVRPLTAEDQDLCLSKTLTTESLKQNLAKACIVQSESSLQLPASLSETLIEDIGSRLAEIDPLSDISLNLSCPECDHSFQASFDAEEYIMNEIGPRNYKELECDVHWLAFHYHWSEQEILSLSTTRRKRYIELVNTTLAGEAL